MRGTPNTLSVPLIFVLLGMLLAACPKTDEATPRDRLHPDRLTNLRGGPLIVEEAGNCPVNEFDTPGQRFHASGSVGGLHLAPPGASIAPEAAGQEAAELAAYADRSEDVGILIVDDFQGIYVLGGRVFELTELDTETLDQLETQGQLSHGALVLHHVNALVAGTGEYLVAESDLQAGTVTWVHEATGARLLVQAVDTEGLDTTVIASRTSDALHELASEHDITRTAVNMSFGIVPCSVVQDFIAHQDQFATFEQYAETLADINEIEQFYDELMELLTTPIDADNEALLRTVRTCTATPVFVASAGNFDLDYSLYPAAWEQVVSVSASDADEPQVRAFFSNAGEVMDVGAWFELSNPENLQGEFEVATDLTYAGTSFSAPAVSLVTALDLSHREPRCDGGVHPDLAHGAADDTALAEAVARYLADEEDEELPQ